MLAWGALSYSAYKKGSCAFKRLAEGSETLSTQISLRENFDLGLTPHFNSLGELPPRHLDLIKNGRFQQFLVSSRSAQEYGVASNFAESSADSHESPRALDLAGGHLPEQNVLKALDQGLYLSNLHYLNWSDLQSARVTGMTRYACFWVEGGEIAAPIEDLRFDNSLYAILGRDLEDLTREPHVDISTSTYFQRALEGKRAPGLLLNRFQFTL